MRGLAAEQGRSKHPQDPSSYTKPPSLDRVPCLLQTKVTALSGKPVGAQYLPSYLSLSSWYSPSQCYLQLQPPSHPLQVRLSGAPFPRQEGPRRQAAHTCLQGPCARFSSLLSPHW